ncbi:MAG: sarcosine oxidase subunit delta [Roseobacter sp.]|jgi:sarcosine oxidase subunit delta|nr:sarcosine oxidase subunit delta [Roseobacter sp.]
MRLTCPLCGERDRREFYYQGDAVALARPAPDAGADAWQDYLHLRENSPAERRDLWQHEAGCGAWLVVTRHTSTHAVIDVALALDAVAQS